jgi:hypothetical protein
MVDLTAIFLTSNAVPEKWAEYHKQVLLEALGDYPIITISRKPMDWGLNLLDTEPRSSVNFYRQLLRGAETATTPYIACVEDDTLYNKEHFTFRPPLDTFAYNLHRWSVSTWTEPFYSFRQSKVGAAGIYPRLETIEALREKLATVPKDAPSGWLWKIGEPGTGGERGLGIKIRKSMDFYTSAAIIQFNHDYFTNADNSPEGVARRHRKAFGKIRATEIPYWGRADKLIQKFQ